MVFKPALEGTTRRSLQPIARDANPAPELYLKDNDEHYIQGQFEYFFSVITEIPDDVLEKGDGKTNQWINEHHHPVSRNAIQDRDLEDRGIGDKIQCGIALGGLIADNAIPLAKLRRIRALVNELGGVRKTVVKLLKAKTKEQRLKVGGQALVKLVELLLGFKDVKEECFS